MTALLHRITGGLLLVSLVAAAIGCSDGERRADTIGTTSGATSVAPPPSTTVSTAPTSTSSPPATQPDERALPSTATELSAELSVAEAMVRDVTLTQDERASWGRRQQLLYRHLATNDRWAEKVVALADSPVAAAIERNWAARRELSSLITSGTSSPTLPAWRIRQPLPPPELLSFYRAGEQATGIGWEFLAAINLVETRMGRIEGLSTAGATGPMQFLPSTWEECCEGDPTVDRDAILGAAAYLVDRGGPTDMDRALRGYNNSDYYVRAVSAYADVLRIDPEAFIGFHAWEVFFRSAAGLVRLPVGYHETEPVDAASWISTNPQHLLSN